MPSRVSIRHSTATLLWSRGKPEDLAQARRRAGVTFSSVVGFVAGCAAGAVLEVQFRLWALALPVVLAVLAIPLGRGAKRTKVV